MKAQNETRVLLCKDGGLVFLEWHLCCADLNKQRYSCIIQLPSILAVHSMFKYWITIYFTAMFKDHSTSELLLYTRNAKAASPEYVWQLLDETRISVKVRAVHCPIPIVIQNDCCDFELLNIGLFSGVCIWGKNTFNVFLLVLFCWNWVSVN